MNLLLNTLAEHAKTRPQAIALTDGHVSISYAHLFTLVNQFAVKFQASDAKVIGLYMDNSPAWAILDLAAQMAGVTVVPLPAFFSDKQLKHAVEDSGIECIYTDQPERIVSLPLIASIWKSDPESIAGTIYYKIHLPCLVHFKKLTGIAKITYTSGTTGTPKGVCLPQQTLDNVSQSLSNALGVQHFDRHLSILPLSTLLENIGAIYVPILAGACSFLMPTSEVGMQGTTYFDAGRMVYAVNKYQITSVILTPQLLHALIETIDKGASLPGSIRFIAVGGAPVAPSMLAHGQRLGLPLHEGYGLSECGSVVAVNTPGDHCMGSVGKPLPHIQLKFSNDGEILVKGNVFTGYLHEKPLVSHDGFWPTGDIGFLDNNGYLHITGRKKNIFITSFGRNVAPEWIECELTAHPAIMQAVVFGENRPWNTAVIVPGYLNERMANKTETDLAISLINHSLPDYAQIGSWIPADAPFTISNGQLTGTGRPRRAVIWHHYQARIDALYVQQEKIRLSQ